MAFDVAATFYDRFMGALVRAAVRPVRGRWRASGRGCARSTSGAGRAA